MNRLTTDMFTVFLFCSFSLFLKDTFFQDYLYKEVLFYFFRQSIIKASIILTFLFISCLLALDLDSIEQRGQTIAYVTFHVLLVSYRYTLIYIKWKYIAIFTNTNFF